MSSSNLVSIVIQKPGQVPDRKGPYPYDQVEPTLRELYKIYPGIVCIVMPGLPSDCYPQHGHEYLDMLDAERCKCEVDEPRNPKCPVDHTRRSAVETSEPQYRKWPGEPPHCMSCDCGMTEEQKALAARTVPLEDYLSVHRELMNLKYPGSSQVEPRETTDDMQVLRGIVNNQAADREFLTVSMALLRRIVRAQEPTYNPETVASIKAAQASGGNAVCCQRFPNCECIPPKAQVKAGDPCPTFDTAVHEAHNGKCMYCGAPIAPVKAAEPQALTEAEQLLQAWADLLPPNGNLYWVHIEKARDYFKRRSAKETSAPLPPEVLANALQDVVHVDDGPVRAGRSVKATDEVRATYNATVDDLNEEQCASIGHEFRPIDSSGQVVCIFCNRRPENGKGNP